MDNINSATQHDMKKCIGPEDHMALATNFTGGHLPDHYHLYGPER